jgi:hypothetical protein
MKRVFAIPLAAVMLTGGFMQSASAELGAVGPVAPQTINVNGIPTDFNFPLYYQDTKPLRLQLCLDDNGFCLLDPTGAEAFWWGAEATAVANGIDGLLVMALEAAFDGAGTAAAGQEVAFARIRIRVTVPAAGTYTVTHPYGTQTFDVADPTVARAINVTQDIGNFGLPGVSFDLALADTTIGTVNADGRSIGPFLRPSATAGGEPLPPVADPVSGNLYIAQPGALTRVTGSPLGTNVFRVEGPGGIVAESELFDVTGKLFATQPAMVEKADYRVQTGKFTVQGTSILPESAPGVPTEVTINLGAEVIGTATVDANGNWSSTGKAPVSPGGAGRSIGVTSTADPAAVPPVPPEGSPTIKPLTLR